MQRTTIGDFELSIVSDGTYVADGGAFFGVVPKSLWSKRVTADEENRITVGLNSLLVRNGKQNVLIETGIGNKMPDRLVKIFGQPAKLLENLSQAGVPPEEIDVVINTHLHFDHCGWNTVRKNGVVQPAFPRAKYYVQEGEWQHARRQLERDAVSYMTDNYDPLVKSGQMVLLKGDWDIAPGISVKIFPGHTANMQAVIIESGGRRACYISDLIPTSAHLDVTWVMAYDLFPLQTIESRKAYYTRAIPQRWLTVFTHDPNVPWGYVREVSPGKMGLTQAADLR
ncbi:MAG TPA: MBL fold metallo-hydrolase [Terriglobales bacterium]|nr:MBL fold metallo-hydrolase [Terriglobales bacterium]